MTKKETDEIVDRIMPIADKLADMRTAVRKLAADRQSKDVAASIEALQDELRVFGDWLPTLWRQKPKKAVVEKARAQQKKKKRR